MTPSHKSLRELAERATPGPWERTRMPGFQHAETALYRVEDDNGHQVADCYDNRVASDAQSESDAAFIAAASPSTVIALLDQIAALEAARDEACDLAERANNAVRCQHPSGWRGAGVCNSLMPCEEHGGESRIAELRKVGAK